MKRLLVKLLLATANTFIRLLGLPLFADACDRLLQNGFVIRRSNTDSLPSASIWTTVDWHPAEPLKIIDLNKRSNHTHPNIDIERDLAFPTSRLAVN